MKTVVEDLMFIRKAFDAYPSRDWHQVLEDTAHFVMGNLRCYRDLYASGEFYNAVGYGSVAFHETKGDRWFISPRFKRSTP